MFAVVGLLVFFISIAYYIYRKNFSRMIELTKDWPGPPSLPILGHAHHLIGKPPEKFLYIFKEFFKIYGGTMKLWIGPYNLIVNDPSDVEIVLGSSNVYNAKAESYNVLDAWLKEGLLISHGSKWFKRRKILTPAFHFKILSQFIETFEQQAKVLIKSLYTKVQDNDSCIVLYDLVNLYTLDTICGKYVIFIFKLILICK